MAITAVEQYAAKGAGLGLITKALMGKANELYVSLKLVSTEAMITRDQIKKVNKLLSDLIDIKRDHKDAQANAISATDEKTRKDYLDKAELYAKADDNIAKLKSLLDELNADGSQNQLVLQMLKNTMEETISLITQLTASTHQTNTKIEQNI